ncbi:MAG TPA: CTP synthase [Pyrinomonadaceae bacterium]|jgi:CTP synthase (UTP-ammonia lyase)
MKIDDEKITHSVGLVGDYNPEVRAHVAIPKALELAAGVTAYESVVTWIATREIRRAVEEQLQPFDALWCVPASPYANMEGALSAIRFARESGRPFLGTCGGFQHALIEYARDVLGLADADHAESNPTAALPLVTPLSCSLVGAKGVIRLKEGSRIEAIYGKRETVEQYHCNFGFNPRYRRPFESGDLKVTGVDEEGDVRVLELRSHPFFVATLFQPELSALEDSAHPLICAFVRAARSFSDRGHSAALGKAGR